MSTGSNNTATLHLEGNLEGPADNQFFVFQDVVTFNAPTTISITCKGFNIFVISPILTATKVDAVY